MEVATELDQIVEELRQADKLLLTTHENPDGDALGSLLGMQELLTQLGKDSLMFMAADEFPLPHEYRHLHFEGLLSGPPEDVEQRVVVFLDCGNIDRMPVDFLQGERMRILNIDHHHDNTRFGTVNLVDPSASCTAEIVYELLRELGGELTTKIADALYLALITDTGRFMYENTSSRSHRLAADLIEAGVEPHPIYRRVYEDLPFGRLKLLSRALASAERYEQGALTVGWLDRDDYEQTGSVETDSEGIVDHLRAVEGTAVAVLIRELLAADRGGVRKVSLRATDNRVDVSRIARKLGGGGHPQAAGLSTELDPAELIAQLRREVVQQLEG